MRKKRNKSIFAPRKKKSWFSIFEVERQEIVYPYMNVWDRRLLEKNVYDKLPSAPSFKQVLPAHLIADIYNLHYYKSENQEYSIIDDTNRGKWKLLQTVNDSSIKIITNDSTINSSILTIEICKAIVESVRAAGALNEMAEHLKNSKAERDESTEDSDGEYQEGEDSDDSDGSSQSQNKGSGSEKFPKDTDGADKSDAKEDRSGTGNKGEEQGAGQSNEDSGQYAGPSESSDENSNRGNNQENKPTKFEDLIQTLITNGNLQNRIAKAKEEALERINEYEQLGIDIERIVQESGRSAMDIVNDIEIIKGELSTIQMNRTGLKSVCQQIINKSIGYFSRKSKANEIGIFEADFLDEIEGLEYLMPVFRNTELHNIITREKVYYGKINVYVDVSGSMDDYTTVGGTTVTRMTFAKALIKELMEMDLVIRVIPFGKNIKNPIDPPDLLKVMMLDANCGTSLDTVVADIIRMDENGLVITDGCDHIHYYSDKAFFIGTSGATFNLRGEAQQLSTNGQLWVFDDEGDTIEQYKLRA